MKYSLQFLLTVSMIVGVAALTVNAQQNTIPTLREMKWNVEGTARKALVYLPAAPGSSKPHPLIVAFHGHGGTMHNMYRTHRFDLLWPEAIVVYPQGLNTPGNLTDPEGKKTGWQQLNAMGNRDLTFFDQMLDSLKRVFNIDDNRVYATGHSNGGNFVYQLWALRGKLFAAFAPTSTLPGKNILSLKPKPAFIVTGAKDPLVKPDNQYLVHQRLLKLNGCDLAGSKDGPYITNYSSAKGTPVTLYIHPGGHEYPQDANAAIINFFKQQILNNKD
ncbi:alpha/beta hydrolase family esterase [Niabella hibiscisoli]|uniref:alpha/beta hydrolase family esterase n=1 Tax=Niabella hibiscisoli TaxID=1825928 RepID=UPI001F103336|nr:esterase [Niabella hibiscisoli]MCH5717516.1 esterase [Niabella hibiscisoli]